jgi:hypothetical protein
MFAKESAARRCSFPGCGRPHLAKGLCRGHYEQQRRKGSLRPLPPRRREDPACDFAGCGNVAVNKGLCQAHANQRRKGQPLRPLRPFYGTKGNCRFEGCSKPRASAGYCAGHAAQHYSGRPLVPLFHPKKDCDYPGCGNRALCPWLLPGPPSATTVGSPTYAAPPETWKTYRSGLRASLRTGAPERPQGRLCR